MQKIFNTKNVYETNKLGKQLAKKICGGEIICLIGELGSGKTTFTQGLLEELNVEKPYNSPTFMVMKEYIIVGGKIKKAYHIDAYRINAEEMLSLGWDEIIADNENICIIEWANKIESILPVRSSLIKFECVSAKERRLIFSKFAKD